MIGVQSLQPSVFVPSQPATLPSFTVISAVRTASASVIFPSFTCAANQYSSPAFSISYVPSSFCVAGW